MELLLPLILGWCFPYYGIPLTVHWLVSILSLRSRMLGTTWIRHFSCSAATMRAITSRRGLRSTRSVSQGAEHGCDPTTSFYLLILFSMSPPLMQLMDAVMLQLTRARNRLTTPASMTLPELATSGLMVRDTRLWTLYTRWSNKLFIHRV